MMISPSHVYTVKSEQGKVLCANNLFIGVWGSFQCYSRILLCSYRVHYTYYKQYLLSSYFSKSQHWKHITVFLVDTSMFFLCIFDAVLDMTAVCNILVLEWDTCGTNLFPPWLWRVAYKSHVPKLCTAPLVWRLNTCILQSHWANTKGTNSVLGICKFSSIKFIWSCTPLA